MSANEPDVTDDEYGKYAVDTQAQPMRVWQFREGVVTNDRTWQNVDSVPESEELQLKFKNATLRPSGWIYAEELDVSEISGEPSRLESADETEGPDYYVEFDNNSRIGGKNQAEAYAEAIRWLISNAALRDRISIPYGLGEKNYVLNDTPKHSQGGDMYRPKEVGTESALYLETSVPKEQKKRHIKKLADRCDQIVTFGGEW